MNIHELFKNNLQLFFILIFLYFCVLNTHKDEI